MAMTLVTAFLPLLLQLISWLVERYVQSEKIKEDMRRLMKSAQDDGLITVKNQDKLKSHREKIKEQLDKIKANRSNED